MRDFADCLNPYEISSLISNDAMEVRRSKYLSEIVKKIKLSI